MRLAQARREASLRGQVVACFGRRSLVEIDSGVVISCVARGRMGGIACGDNVRIVRSSASDGVIEAIDPRACLLYRSDAKHEKAIAANITQVVAVLAVVPAPNTDFIDRCLVAAEHVEARVLLVLNKTDLPNAQSAISLIERYGALGYRTMRTSRNDSPESLLAELATHLSVFIGASGVGKSTLVNRLVPAADARVGEISAGRDTGRHTTTRTQLYRIDGRTAIIDSPGMHAFGLSHFTPADVANAFVEFRSCLGQCRFSDCRHDGEPGCAVDASVQNGRIAAERVFSYRKILASLR